MTYVSDNNAKCGENGTETATCTREGCNATDTRELADSALDHSFLTYAPDNNATCLENGTETAICSREGCNATDTREDADSALDHSFVTYTPDNNAACEKNGTETATCSREGCNATDTREITGSALEHDFQNYVYNNDATCQALGTETAICERPGCNEPHTRTKEDLYGDHVFDRQVQDTAYFAHAADCTHKLSYYYSCACGACGTETFEVGDFYHDYSVCFVDDFYLASAANCERPALYYKSCSCGAIGTETFEDGDPRHTFDQEVIDAKYLKSAANCQNGTAYYCSCVCGEAAFWDVFYVGEPDPNAHSYNSYVVNPKKYEGGYTYYYCKCGDNYKTNETPPSGSSGLKYTTVGCEEGTCMVSGYLRYSDDNDGVIVVPAVRNGLSVVGIADATETYKNIPTGAFFNLTSITKVVLPDTLKYIGTGAFYECDNIREIDFGKGLERIGAYAFYNCYALLHVTLPESMTQIDDYAFYNSHIRSINLPTSITTIRRNALYGAPGRLYIYTKHAEMPATWTFIPATNNEYTVLLGVQSHGETEDGIRWVKRADGTVLIMGSNKDIKNLAIPETIDGGTVTEIASYAFKAEAYNYVSGGSPQRIDYLVTVTLPDTVTLIGQSAFSDCQLLTTVKLSASLVKIDNYAFEKCNKLGNVVFPDTLEYIGREAFLNCHGMTKIFIPKTVTFIGYHGLFTSVPSNYYEYHYYVESESTPDTWDAEWYKDSGYVYLYFGASPEDAA